MRYKLTRGLFSCVFHRDTAVYLLQGRGKLKKYLFVLWYSVRRKFVEIYLADSKGEFRYIEFLEEIPEQEEEELENELERRFRSLERHMKKMRRYERW